VSVVNVQRARITVGIVSHGMTNIGDAIQSAAREISDRRNFRSNPPMRIVAPDIAAARPILHTCNIHFAVLVVEAARLPQPTDLQGRCHKDRIASSRLPIRGQGFHSRLLLRQQLSS